MRRRPADRRRDETTAGRGGVPWPASIPQTAAAAETPPPVIRRFAIALYPLVRPLVVEQRLPGGAQADRLDHPEDDVVAADRLDVADAAVERHHRRGEHRRPGRERRPFAGLETLLAVAAAPGKQVGDRLLAGAQGIDAEHPVGAHDR